MNLEDRINLPGIEIIEETEEGYRVNYDDEEVYISKSDESTFSLASPSNGISQEQSLRQFLVPRASITQDTDAPQEYLTAMMMHELREKEYAEAGFGNAHERALNDEVLFVLKTLDSSQREGYFAFADDYRQRALEESQRREEEEEQGKVRQELERDCKDENGYWEAEAENYNIYEGHRGVRDGIRSIFLMCTNKETAERVNSLTRELPGLGVNGTIRMTARNGVSTNFFVDDIPKIKGDLAPHYEEPMLITGSKELVDALAEKGIEGVRLYNPLKDLEPYEELRRIIEE